MSLSEPNSALTRLNVEHECLANLSVTADQLLKFRLYEDAEGIWVCCDWCPKWRYLPDDRDPAVFIKRDFRCVDVKKKCNVGDDEGFDQTFYETKYCAGSLVWVKRPDGRKEKDWLWWPALVEDCPDTVSQYFLLDGSSDIPIAYHVTFLDAYRTCGWMREDLIKPFDPSAKGLNKPHSPRRGRRPFPLHEAVKRAIIASKYDIVGRLENFSYNAHVARLGGSIASNKTPVDKILNGTEEVEVTRKVSNRATNEATAAKRAQRSRKRTLDTDQSELPSKKAPKPMAPVTKKTREAERKPPQEEAAAGRHVASSKKADSQMSDDSGCVFDEKASKEDFPENRRELATAGTSKPAGEGKRILSSEEPSSQDEGIESQESGLKADKPETQRSNKAPRKSETPPEDVRGAKATRKNKKVTGHESQSLSEKPIKSLHAKSATRKRAPPKNSGIESSTESSWETGASGIKKTAVGNHSVESESMKLDQDSETGGLAGSPPTLAETPPVSEQDSEKVDYDSESNTLDATPNLKVVRKRRPKKQDPVTVVDKLPKNAAFTQPLRQVESMDSMKSPYVNQSQDTTTSDGPSPSFSMSQPVPSRKRSRFAPPTRPKAETAEYLIDDFNRDLTEGVI